MEKGTLKFHGVSKTIQLPVQTTRSGKQLTVRGAVQLDHRDFKLDKIRMASVVTVKLGDDKVMGMGGGMIWWSSWRRWNRTGGLSGCGW